MDRCLVKTNGVQCKKPRVTRGMCELHRKHFAKLIEKGFMTWSFLELSGEALPVKKKGAHAKRK